MTLLLCAWTCWTWWKVERDQTTISPDGVVLRTDGEGEDAAAVLEAVKQFGPG
jgi:hypothetical protein